MSTLIALNKRLLVQLGLSPDSAQIVVDRIEELELENRILSGQIKGQREMIENRDRNMRRLHERIEQLEAKL